MISELCKTMLKKKACTIQEYCQFIEQSFSVFPAVPHGNRFYRQLENQQIIALKQACDQFEWKINVSQIAVSDINQWLKNIDKVVKPLCRGGSNMIIEIDANCSLKGRGGGGFFYKLALQQGFLEGGRC